MRTLKFPTNADFVYLGEDFIRRGTTVPAEIWNKAVIQMQRDGRHTALIRFGGEQRGI